MYALLKGMSFGAAYFIGGLAAGAVYALTTALKAMGSAGVKFAI